MPGMGHAEIARAVVGAGVAMVLMAAVAGCAPEPRPGVTHAASPGVSPAPTTSLATFVSVTDGDTIVTSAGTVRLIGIDTPERGECGHDEASAAIGRMLSPGDAVSLELPPGQNDRDRHERLLRHVSTEAGVDLALMQLEAGNAIARYDSTDGRPEHPREDAYRAAQLATAAPDGSVITRACGERRVPESPPPSAEASERSDGDRWWARYPSCAKLERNDAGHWTGPFERDDPATAEIYDWFAHGTGNRGDGDGDGLACE